MEFQSTNNHIYCLASKSRLKLNSYTRGLQTAAGQTTPAYNSSLPTFICHPPPAVLRVLFIFLGSFCVLLFVLICLDIGPHYIAQDTLQSTLSLAGFKLSILQASSPEC